MDKRIKGLTRSVVLLTAAFLLLNAARVEALVLDPDNPLNNTVGLETLIGGGTVQVGDKIFTDFGITGDYDADDVDVVAIQDKFGFGISFRGGFIALGNETKDFILSFSVEVAPGFDRLISDVHLSFNGDVSGEGLAKITEQIFDDGPVPLGELLAQMSVENPPPIGAVQETFFLEDPLPKLFIVKNVKLRAGTGALSEAEAVAVNNATISVIDQTFSQIPEPGTVLLVAMGLLGVALTGRRQK